MRTPVIRARRALAAVLAVVVVAIAGTLAAQTGAYGDGSYHWGSALDRVG